MTGESSVFSSSVTPHSQTMCLADGYTTQIHSKGTIHLSLHITFSSVLHIPNFYINLLSINRLIKNLNCDIIFLPNVAFYKIGLRRRILANDTSMTVCITFGILHGSEGCLLVSWHLFCLTLSHLYFHLEF